MNPAEEEPPAVVTVTNVQLQDLPITFPEIKEAVLDLAIAIQHQEQGLDPPQTHPPVHPQSHSQPQNQSQLQQMPAMTEE